MSNPTTGILNYVFYEGQDKTETLNTLSRNHP